MCAIRRCVKEEGPGKCLLRPVNIGPKAIADVYPKEFVLMVVSGCFNQNPFVFVTEILEALFLEKAFWFMESACFPSGTG